MSDILPIGRLGPSISSEREDRSAAPMELLSLEEHDRSSPIPLSDDDVAFLNSLTEMRSAQPLEVSFTKDGLAVIETGAHVGTVTLPSGMQIEVTPKQTVTRLLWALQYAFETPVEPLKLETSFAGASSFFDALGVLFQAELQAVLTQGLHRGYVRQEDVRDHVQGQIDVQRQLQRPSAVTTDFMVMYDEYTTDTTLNRAVLAALRTLLLLVRDNQLASRLRQQEQQLREFVSVKPVSVEEVKRIELSRLNDHYEALLELAQLTLERKFFEDIRAGERRSLALFVNMNEVFERMTERAFRSAARQLGSLRVEGQASIPNLVDGPHAVSMRPDILVTRDEDVPVTVADAKWKTGTTSSSDVYQLTSYILALDTPGALVYPSRDGGDTKKSTVRQKYPLRTIELATNPAVVSYDAYVAALEESAYRYLTKVN